ncbi:very short patch repair endonuclease [Nocardia farcinica]|uniref:very short patch repair endonuclease n=1 Tax=Nocardia farcinica TaxID=37329 RepID=UPI0018952F32|nr:very short patch repair endonuclease [Nocardia farcinica]MBF6070280.1 very short patch repair endonuclease [Nocardia farcinica]MBF6234391.1 very short patch repair endonuclease [Nocardia farcinica]MBF6251895.1 very short patch repair endonuclease [Nocardia farcinica]MBF6262648.1 very short patch repair endonuclease [Nocardia farcinica]MBF6281152.1 very short patch repair endonuclease [Nocardia farcinica]
MTRATESWASTPAVRKSMRANRRRDTAPEVAVRKLLHARGLRYRVDYAPDRGHLRNRADIVFTRARVAVFIDGCWWHGCTEHHRAPRANNDYWSSKIRRNAERDRYVNEMLREQGWTVLRFWEHQGATEIADGITQEILLARRGAAAPGSSGHRPRRAR